MSSEQTRAARWYGVLWYVALATALAGAVGVGVRWWPEAWVLLTVGSTVLVAGTVRAAWRATRSETASPPGGLLTLVAGACVLLGSFVISSNVSILDLPLAIRVVALVTGAQVFLLITDMHVSTSATRRRLAVPLAGHAITLFGSILVLGVGAVPVHPRAAVIAYAVGFTALALQTFWSHRHVDGAMPPRPFTRARHWEGALIVALCLGMGGAAVVSFTAPPATTALVPSAIAWRVAGVVGGAAAICALATLAAPPASPDLLRLFTSTGATIVQHTAVAAMSVNALVLTVLLVVPERVEWLLWGYLGVLLLGVCLEYATVVHAHRWRGREQTPVPSLSPDEPVTVVVTAANEGAVLPESLEYNLEALDDLQFLLVPASSSTDRTEAIAREFSERYERVRVVAGTTGSKAGDLTEAWEHIQTPYALVLDADETVDESFVARGLACLRDRPEVGVVQGRKVATDPYTTRLVRFVSAERRYSTWLEHPFMNRVFGAAHFAGSAALIRRETPPSVGGWSPETLTEDIDFTIRLSLQTDWEVTYVPEMVAQDLNVRTPRGLIRQRVRWSRGWVQVAMRHWPTLVRSRQVGWRQTFGLSWLLFTAVSAPAYIVFPALAVVAAVGLGSSLPLAIAVGVGVVLLLARGISIGYATLRDPVIPLERTPARVVEMVVHAYAWILLSWALQLHALYLQFAGAPSVWHVTQKRGTAPGDIQRRRGASQSRPEPVSDD